MLLQRPGIVLLQEKDKTKGRQIEVNGKGGRQRQKIVGKKGSKKF